MRPLHAVAGGILLVAIDFRTTSLDLLPDVGGWLLLLWAAWCWRERTLMAVAAVGAACSLPLLALPYHYVQYDQLSGETVVVTDEMDLGYAEHLEYDPLSGWDLAAYGTSALAAAAAVLLVVRFVARNVVRWDGPSTRRSLARLRVLGWVFVATWAVPRGAAAIANRDDGLAPVWGDPAAKIALVGAIGAVSFAIAVMLEAREPWARSLRQRPRTTPMHDEAVADE